MRRRRLAVALAVVLALVAGGLGVIAWIVFCGPRDHRLVRLLRKTQRIEMSDLYTEAWAIFEVREEDVPGLVEAAANGLERARGDPPAELNFQVRFLLETGEHVLVAVCGKGEAKEWRFVARLPGDSAWRVFRGTTELDATIGRAWSRAGAAVTTFPWKGERGQVFLGTDKKPFLSPCLDDPGGPVGLHPWLDDDGVHVILAGGRHAVFKVQPRHHSPPSCE